MSSLSERQRKILQFIVSFVNDNEFPPTIREIGEQVGISSTSVVNYNLAKLEELGLISRRKEVSRGLALNWDRLNELNPALAASLAAPATPPMPNIKHNGHGKYNGHGENFLPSMMRIPVLGAVAAGQPIQVEAMAPETTDDWVELPDGVVKTRGPLFALRVKGDSMIDASVLNGDVVVLRQQETANDGEMVAAWIEGDEETTLKYLYREGRNVRLQPANPAYAPIIRPANKVRINGRVVYIIRSLDN
jgi:repressor LexA